MLIKISVCAVLKTWTSRLRQLPEFTEWTRRFPIRTFPQTWVRCHWNSPWKTRFFHQRSWDKSMPVESDFTATCRFDRSSRRALSLMPHLVVFPQKVGTHRSRLHEILISWSSPELHTPFVHSPLGMHIPLTLSAWILPVPSICAQLERPLAFANRRQTYASRSVFPHPIEKVNGFVNWVTADRRLLGSSTIPLQVIPSAPYAIINIERSRSSFSAPDNPSLSRWSSLISSASLLARYACAMWSPILSPSMIRYVCSLSNVNSHMMNKTIWQSRTKLRQ